MTITRRVLSALLIWMILLPATASAQELPDPTPLLDALGTTEDEVRAAPVNPSWDGLGVFSEDVNRLLGVAAEPIAPITYAFGDDPNGTPLFTTGGSVPVGQGALLMRLPDDWAPPADGFGSDLAFAQTAGNRLAPGEDVFFFWVRYPDPYDFDPARYINEGFPLTLPGLPVWNSSFAGDTWEGANLIPNAVYGDGVLTFDVKSYAPPQSFPLVDLPGFYYRSGDVMAMALGAQALSDYALAAGATIGDDTTGGAAEDAPQTLLWTGGDRVEPAQFDPDDLGLFLIVLRILFYSHLTETGQFQPGLIAFLDAVLGEDFTDFLIVMNRQLFPPPEDVAEEVIEEAEEATDEVVEEVEDAVDDVEESTTETDDPVEAAADEVEETVDQAAAEAADPGEDGDGGGFPWIVLIIIALVLLVIVIVIVRTMTSRSQTGSTRATGDPAPTPPATRPGGGETAMILDPMDGVPPEEDEPATQCGWEVLFDDGGNWIPLKRLEPGEQRCCVYRIRIVTDTLFNDAVASFRQDAPAERQYIPVLEQAPNALDWDGTTATRSGPAGRQDWQHGDGDPVDTSGQGDPMSYWQVGQGEERPDVTSQIFHLEQTTVEVTLEPGCTGHVNTFASESEARLWVMSSQECTNDDPGPACPVELTAFGAADALATGDTNLWVGYAHGTDPDELERHAAALAEMAPAERDRWTPPVLEVTGGWDGHDHVTRDKLDLENSSTDTSSESKDGAQWQARFSTNAALMAGQLVPVHTWPTTERVSTHVQFGLGLSLDLTATLTTPDCPDDCSGHPGLRCHGGAGFTLHLGSAGSFVSVGGDVVTIDRPDSAGPGRALRTGPRTWQIDTTATPPLAP